MMEGAPTKTENIDQLQTPEELIEFRIKQSWPSRLAEYITGLRPDDPKMVERLITDQKILRKKYNLPDRELSFDSPVEYERILRQRAEELGVRIKEKSQCGSFFKDVRMAAGVYLDTEKAIGATIDKETEDTYGKSLGVLEHELIHAVQNRYSQRMPIELMEYEAYVAGFNTNAMLADPEGVEWAVFTFFIGGSVDHWYKEQNSYLKEGEAEIIPVWKKPEYFLRNVDKVDENLIKAALEKSSVEPEV